jgi:tetratricopeptide (TPR) repeat protein
VVRRRRAVTRENYKEYCRDQELFFEREMAAGAHVTRLLGAARGLGHMYAEFGEVEAAKIWYARALRFLSELRSDPSTVAAHMLWRSRDFEGLQAECSRAVTYHGARVQTLKNEAAAATDDRRQGIERSLALAYFEIAVCELYLKNFRAAAEIARQAEQEAPFGALEMRIVRGLADSIDRQDSVTYERALREARSRAEPWPTFESDSAIDLYRLSLAYAKEYFGSIPTDLDAELLG